MPVTHVGYHQATAGVEAGSDLKNAYEYDRRRICNGGAMHTAKHS